VETVPVPEPKPGETLNVESGILGRGALIRQARAARETIEKHRPDRIVTLGGDCLIDLAPMAYLNTRYRGDLGVLWVDAHPDVLTPREFAQGNAQVLGAILGKGDSDLVGEVDTPVKSRRRDVRLDELRTGCVIRYPYLWVREAGRGETEGPQASSRRGRCADHQTKGR
jgi:Arginase family